MLDRHTAPLEIACGILKPETIRYIQDGGYADSLRQRLNTVIAY